MRNTVILLLSLTVMVINGGNIVRHVPETVPELPPPLIAVAVPAPGCDYDCSGWPYKQCKVTKTFKYGGFKSATCISPYYSKSSYRMYSNYPECATVPSGCDRCDEVCSSWDHHDKYDYTETGPQYSEHFHISSK